MKATALIAVTHLLGSGHLVRAANLARALAQAGFAVTLASGGMPLRAMAEEPFAFVQLPPVRTEGVDFRTLLDEAGRLIVPERKKERIGLLQALAAKLRPDVVVVEHFPFGRRQLAAVAGEPTDPMPYVDAAGAVKGFDEDSAAVVVDAFLRGADLGLGDHGVHRAAE